MLPSANSKLNFVFIMENYREMLLCRGSLFSYLATEALD